MSVYLSVRLPACLHANVRTCIESEAITLQMDWVCVLCCAVPRTKKGIIMIRKKCGVVVE